MNPILCRTSLLRVVPLYGNPGIVTRCNRMEGEIRALTRDLRAKKDDLNGAMDEIKIWRGKDDATKKCGFGSEKSKHHKNVVKGGSKAATS